MVPMGGTLSHRCAGDVYCGYDASRETATMVAIEREKMFEGEAGRG